MEKIKGILFIIMSAISYGVMTTIVKKAYAQGFDENQLLVGQLIISSLFLWGIALYQWVAKNAINEDEVSQLAKTEVCFTDAIYDHTYHEAKSKNFKIDYKGISKLVLIGMIGQGFTTIFYFKALALLPASIAIFLIFQFALITVLFDMVKTRKIPNALTLLALGIIIIGTFLGVNLWSISGTLLSFRGILYGLASAATFAVFLYFTGNVKTNIDVWVKSPIMISSAALIVILFYFPEIVFKQVFIFEVLIWIIPLALVGQIIPILLFNIGLPIVGGRLGSLLGTIELPATILLAFLFLGEEVSTVQWLGMFAIIIGIIIANKGEGTT